MRDILMPCDLFLNFFSSSFSSSCCVAMPIRSSIAHLQKWMLRIKLSFFFLVVVPHLYSLVSRYSTRDIFHGNRVVYAWSPEDVMILFCLLLQNFDAVFVGACLFVHSRHFFVVLLTFFQIHFLKSSLFFLASNTSYSVFMSAFLLFHTFVLITSYGIAQSAYLYGDSK